MVMLGSRREGVMGREGTMGRLNSLGVRLLRRGAEDRLSGRVSGFWLALHLPGMKKQHI